MTLDLLKWPRHRNSEASYPSLPGLYALFVRKPETLPGVECCEQGLIYIGLGQGANGLKGRCHFSGKTSGHSPRRSLAALLHSQLNLVPMFIQKPSGATTFKLEPASELALNQWMEANLLVALNPITEPRIGEKNLIERWRPPLNCDGARASMTDSQKAVLDMRAKLKARARMLGERQGIQI